MYFLDGGFFVFVLPALLFAMYAQARVRGAYQRYARVFSRRGITAAQLASLLLKHNGLHHIQVGVSPGQLTDHYDPRHKIVRLSEGVYHSSSLAALGIAAHEVGHALQHRDGYVPLQIRNSIVPVAQLGSTLAFPLFFVGLFMGLPFLVDIGIWLFLGAVLFQVVTLPVEFNASRRAISILREGNFLSGEELRPVREVLNAAALTYVAATAMAIAQLLRLLALANRRD